MSQNAQVTTVNGGTTRTEEGSRSIVPGRTSSFRTRAEQNDYIANRPLVAYDETRLRAPLSGGNGASRLTYDHGSGGGYIADEASWADTPTFELEPPESRHGQHGRGLGLGSSISGEFTEQYRPIRHLPRRDHTSQEHGLSHGSRNNDSRPLGPSINGSGFPRARSLDSRGSSRPGLNRSFSSQASLNRELKPSVARSYVRNATLIYSCRP